MSCLRGILLGLLILATAALSFVAETAPVSAQGAKESKDKVKIRWLGQSMFEIITPKNTSIYLDPHYLEAYRIKQGSLKADLVLMSHLHTDHTSLEPFENKKTLRALNALQRLPDGKRTDWNKTDEDFKDVRIRIVPTYHDSSRGLSRGLNGCWVIDVAGLRIVHLGDLGHLLNDGQLKSLGTVDILMVPVGGVYTLNGIDAQRVVDQIKPRRWVLPMHYGTLVYDDLLSLKYFLDEQEEKTPVEKFKPKMWLEIDAKSALPTRHSIGVLHYEW